MLEIKLPWPDKALFPNARGGRHWASFQRQKEKARTDGYVATKAALSGGRPISSGKVSLTITFMAPNRIRRDLDGMHGAIKHHLDGIAKALGVDDSVFRPVLLDVELDPDKKGFVLVGGRLMAFPRFLYDDPSKHVDFVRREREKYESSQKQNKAGTARQELAELFKEDKRRA